LYLCAGNGAVLGHMAWDRPFFYQSIFSRYLPALYLCAGNGAVLGHMAWDRPFFYQSIFSRYLPALYLLRANSHCSTRAFVVCGKRFKAGKSVVQAFYGKLFWGRS